MENKRVLVKEVSSRGHDEHDFDVDEALDYIQQAVKTGKWLYINNQFKTPDQVTLEDIATAEDIVLTNGLVGG